MLAVSDIVSAHDRALARWWLEPAADVDAGPAAAGPALEDLVESGHHANWTIWCLEDEARRHDLPAERVAAIKRAIDRWNQRRNDLMERIDAVVLDWFAKIDVASAELHSETAGMIIDRLSILALKIRNVETIAADASAEADQALALECGERATLLRRQRDDLAGCLVRLLEDFARGRRYFRSYRQLKAYNDPRLNRAVRAAARQPAPASLRKKEES